MWRVGIWLLNLVEEKGENGGWMGVNRIGI